MKKLLLNALALSFIASSAMANVEIDGDDNTCCTRAVSQIDPDISDFEMMDTHSVVSDENKENTVGDWVYEKGKKVAKKGARRALGTAAAKASAPIAPVVGGAVKAATATAVTAGTGNPLLGYFAGEAAGSAATAAVPVVAYQAGYYSPEIAKGVGKVGKVVVKGGKAVVRGGKAAVKGGMDRYYGQEGDLVAEVL